MPPVLRGARGFTLVELMVGLLLSLFLLLVVTQVIVNGRLHRLYAQGQQEAQDSGRYAAMLLDRELGRAGYRRSPVSPAWSVDNVFPAYTDPSTSCAFSAGQAVSSAGDTALCLRYMPFDTKDVDCAGKSPGNATYLDEAYPSAPPGTGDLLSQTFYEKIAVTGDTLACNGITLASGVKSAVFESALDSDADGIVDSYAKGSTSSAIVGVRYTLLLDSASTATTQGIASTVCDHWKDIAGSSDTACSTNDGKLYSIASGTMMLRNLMP